MELKDHLISRKKAKVLQREYVKTRGCVISEILTKERLIKGEDSRDFWFSIDLLKEFIFKVEKQAREEGRCKDLGIRIFLGAYPKEEGYKDPGYSTLFLMPGYKDGKMMIDEVEKCVEDKQLMYAEKSTESSDELVLNLVMGGKPPVEL